MDTKLLRDGRIRPVFGKIPFSLFHILANGQDEGYSQEFWLEEIVGPHKRNVDKIEYDGRTVFRRASNCWIWIIKCEMSVDL